MSQSETPGEQRGAEEGRGLRDHGAVKPAACIRCQGSHTSETYRVMSNGKCVSVVKISE